MDTRRVAIGTVVSGATLSGTGYLIFGVLLPEFYTDFMKAGSATGVAREPLLWWAIALGMLSYGLLIALAVETSGSSGSVRAGMMTGAIVSFLAWFTADFILFGISNVGNLFGILVDPLLEAVPGALAGGAVAAVRKVPGHRSHARYAA